MTLAPGSTLPVLEMNRSGIVLVYSLLCLIFFFFTLTLVFEIH